MIGNLKRKNIKAQSVMDLFIFIAIVFVVIFLFAVLKYGFNLLNISLLSINMPENDLHLNITEHVQNSFSYVNSGLSALKLLSFVIIFGMVLSILISYFLVKAHPVFIGAYIFILLIAIIFAIIVSNAYSSVLGDSSLLNDAVSEFTMSDFVMKSLPIWVTVIGLMGMILLFSSIPYDSGIGGSLG